MIRTVLAFLCAFAASPAAGIDFSRDIQPILSENCCHCHGQDANERKADLRLDVEKDAKAAGLWWRAKVTKAR
jgi:hypothetical protein